ncbi:MAG: IS1595 family transposase [Chromatiales bacterium]|nr:IS1595 family transposase [Chromatiales bacterium]
MKRCPTAAAEKACAKRFSVKTGTVMEGSKLGFRVWPIATFLPSTNLRSVSSMKLHRDLYITQKSAWFLAHRLRRALDRDGDMLSRPVEVDETYFGGKRKNMSNAKRRKLSDQGAGRGTAGKVAVVGIRSCNAARVFRAQT